MSAQIITGAEAEQIKAAGNRLTDGNVAALRAGNVLWFAGRCARQVSGGYCSHFASTDLRIRTRMGERDGEKGVYVWTEPRKQYRRVDWVERAAREAAAAVMSA